MVEEIAEGAAGGAAAGGPAGRPRSVEVPEAGMPVEALRRRVAAAVGAGAEPARVRLFFGGAALADGSVFSPLLAPPLGASEGDKAGGALLWVLAPRPPKRARLEEQDGSFEEDLEQDFRVDWESLGPRQRAVGDLLRRRLGLSGASLKLTVQILGLSNVFWALFVAWVAAGVAVVGTGLEHTYLALSILLVVFLNLGRRRAGESSAYSVFNNFRTLPGQLTGDMIDDMVRRGQM